MSRAELAGGFGVPTAATISSHVEDAYLRRIQALPEQTRQLMLIAAADPTADASLLWRASHTLDIERAAAAAAESEQLLLINGTVRFRHPLVRSAAYVAATPRIAAWCMSRSPLRQIPRAVPSTGYGIWPPRQRERTTRLPPSSSARRRGPQHGWVVGGGSVPTTLGGFDSRVEAVRRLGVGRGACAPASRRARAPREAGSRSGSRTRSTTCSVPESNNWTDRSMRPQSPGARRRGGCCEPRELSKH